MLRSAAIVCLFGAASAFVPATYAGLIQDPRYQHDSLQPRPQEPTNSFTLPGQTVNPSKSAAGLVQTSTIAKQTNDAAAKQTNDAAAKQTKDAATQKWLPNTQSGILDGQKRTFDPVPQNANTRCDKNREGGIVPGIMSTSNPNEQIFTDTVEECQDKCNAIDSCEYITYYTGEQFKGRCIMTNWCADFPRHLNPDQGYTTQVYKKACVCIHHYPDVPCTCQKPHITFEFPNQNAGADAVYDPMNPSANNGGNVGRR
jgi:hypothetical protein